MLETEYFESQVADMSQSSEGEDEFTLTGSDVSDTESNGSSKEEDKTDDDQESDGSEASKHPWETLNEQA